MSEGISNSRFYMWRAVVSMAHADGVVTPQELSFINDYLKDIALSEGQRQIIGQDIGEVQDVYQLFSNIKNRQDKADFFALARALSWCDGDFDAQEKYIIEHLERIVVENKEIVQESRELCAEIELCENQWKFKTERSRQLFGFLNNLSKTQAV